MDLVDLDTPATRNPLRNAFTRSRVGSYIGNPRRWHVRTHLLTSGRWSRVERLVVGYAAITISNSAEYRSRTRLSPRFPAIISTTVKRRRVRCIHRCMDYNNVSHNCTVELFVCTSFSFSLTSIIC